MEIIQKSMFHSDKTTFVFHDDFFTYTSKDDSDAISFDVNYSDVPDKYGLYQERNGSLMVSVGIVSSFIMYAFACILYDKSMDMLAVKANIAALFGALYFNIHKPKKDYFTTSFGKTVFILHDKNREKVTNELKHRRNGFIRKKHFEISPDNHPSLEIEKFDWMKKEGIITSEEYEVKIKALNDILDKESIKSTIVENEKKETIN